MYKLEYLPAARRDLVDIVWYISQELHNPEAAERLIDKFDAAVADVLEFPYSCPVYTLVRPLKHEYRKIIVQNYLLLYWVDESNKVVTVARVMYYRRNYRPLLEE